MRVLDRLRLRWFLIGFFNSAEGWNWECPFDVNNVRDDAVSYTHLTLPTN